MFCRSCRSNHKVISLELRGQHGSERDSVLTSTRRTISTAHRQEKERANRDRPRRSSRTRLSAWHVTTWPNNALATCAMKDKEVEELRELAYMVMSDARQEGDQTIASELRLVASEQVKVSSASRHSSVLQHRQEGHRRRTSQTGLVLKTPDVRTYDNVLKLSKRSSCER